MDSFTSLRLTPPTYQAQWDAVPQWDNPSHHHGPEMQLAHSRQRGEGGGQHNEEIREATPHWEHWKKSADHQAELDMIRYENNKLHSTRLAITGQMAELERVKYEMMKLMDKASSLHPHSDATGNHYTPQSPPDNRQPKPHGSTQPFHHLFPLLFRKKGRMRAKKSTMRRNIASGLNHHHGLQK
ncbi:hypothetical protein DPEC_G00313470 [Dallia pectoralis]|uniref:Uncharacterized protein n=1 Tax=Dallia pectoralis TaxID=75939 RepID=A0ACC2FC57_DALPE|nr:hypothetical protein DPEC_G00313470 [Dallia pectoralis]